MNTILRLRELAIILIATLFTQSAKASDNGTVDVWVGNVITIWNNVNTDHLILSWEWTKSNDNIQWYSKQVDECQIKGLKANTTTKLTYKAECMDRYYYASYTLIDTWTIHIIQPVEEIILDVKSATLQIGEKKQINATILPSDATYKTVEWTSTNPAVATVSSNGEVTAVGEGATTIYCTHTKQNNKWDYCSITVGQINPVEDITLNYTSVSLAPGSTKQLTATVLPNNATDRSVTWSSSNNNVATVSSLGLVTAIGVGKATITCKANDGSGKQATCEVTVSNIKSYSYFTAKTIEGVEMQFYVGDVSSGECKVSGTSWNNPAISKNTTGKITIPEEVGGLKVTEIAGDAFRDCTGITSVIVPASVESIGSSVFHSCTGLTSVSLGNGVKSIESHAFFGCSSLTTITGYGNVELIERLAFRCENGYIPWYNNQPDGLMYIGKVLYTYKGTMPDNTSVRIINGTKNIASECFKGCNGLVGVSIPESVFEIGNDNLGAFDNCPNLGTITVDSSNAKYDSRNNCNAIIETATNTMIVGCKNSTFPSSVKAIGKYAFYGSGIKKIVIPNNIESIADLAFTENESLTSIVIGKGVSMMGNRYVPFYGNMQVSSIIVVPANSYFDSRDNCNAIIETSTDKLITGCTYTVIPSTVKTIGTKAFEELRNTHITIPDNVEKIEKSAFSHNSLSSVTIGKNVKEIGENAFGGCSKLRAIYSLAENPVDIDEAAFSDYTWYSNIEAVYENATLYVPVGTKYNYKVASGWSKFKNIVEFDPTQIKDSVNDDDTVKDEPVFSLGGQRLKAPQKGINIINGKKVMVK